MKGTFERLMGAGYEPVHAGFRTPGPYRLGDPAIKTKMEPAPRLERGTLAVRKPCSGQIELDGPKSGCTSENPCSEISGDIEVWLAAWLGSADGELFRSSDAAPV